MHLSTRSTSQKLLLFLPAFTIPYVILRSHAPTSGVHPHPARNASTDGAICDAHVVGTRDASRTSPGCISSRQTPRAFATRYLHAMADNSAVALYRSLCINWRHGAPKTPHALLELRCASAKGACAQMETALFWQTQRTLPPQICSKHQYAMHPRLKGVTLLAQLRLSASLRRADLRGVRIARLVLRDSSRFNFHTARVSRVIVHADGFVPLWKLLRNDSSELSMFMKRLFEPFVVRVVNNAADFERLEKTRSRSNSTLVYLARSARAFSRTDEYFCLPKAIITGALDAA